MCIIKDKNHLIDEILIASDRSNFILDAVSKSYLQIKDKLHFYKIGEKIERKAFDLKTLKLEDQVKTYDIDSNKKMIGLVFTDQSIQDTKNNESNQCFKCLSQKENEKQEKDLKDDQWVCFAYQHESKDHDYIQMTITRFEDFESSKKQKFTFSQNQNEDKTIGIGLGKWVQKVSDNKENVFLALCKKKKNSDFDQTINIVQVNKTNKSEGGEYYSLTKIQANSFNPFIGHIKIQFLEFYDNILHQIYRIDQTIESKDKKKFFTIKTFQTHNKIIDEAFTKLLEDHAIKEKVKENQVFKDQCYSILNFKYDRDKAEEYQQMTVIQMILKGKDNEEPKIVYIKSRNDQAEGSNKSHFRVAQQWNPENNENGLAESYLLSNKGMVQLHPGYNNIFINCFNNIQVDASKSEEKFSDWDKLEGMNTDSSAKRINSSASFYENKFDKIQIKICSKKHKMILVKLKDKKESLNCALCKEKYDKELEEWKKKKNDQDQDKDRDKNKPKASKETAKEDQKMEIVNPKDAETTAKDKNKPKTSKETARDQKKEKEPELKKIQIMENDLESQSYYMCEGSCCKKEKYHQKCAPGKEAQRQFRQLTKTDKINEFHDKSRSIKLSIDDRKCFPRLHFDEESKQIQLRVFFDNPRGLHDLPVIQKDKNDGEKQKQLMEIVDAHQDIINAPQQTVLSASSVVERSNPGEDYYRQNFQVALMDKSGMWVKIKEYSLKWHDSEDCDPEKVFLNFVGMKLLILRRPIDSSQQKKVLNFLPYFPENNYMIHGTQIIPSSNDSSETYNDHVVLKNFDNSDFQFKGDLFASGYKIYVEDGNHSKQKYLLFESQFIEKNWNIPDQESKFNSMDLNVLFEQQIIVMMNMVPLRDVHTGENFLQEENDDFLAPLEILNGASMCTYELDNEQFIKNQSLYAQDHILQLLGHDLAGKLQHDYFNVDLQKQIKYRTSLLENFLKQYDCKCDKTEKITSLINSFPRDQGWKRDMFEVSQDLNFLNPIIRALDDNIRSQYTDEKNEDDNVAKQNKDKKIKKIVITNAKHLIDKFILNRKFPNLSYQTYQILLCSINLVLDLQEEHDFSMYTKFFCNESQENGNKNLYSFARLLDDPLLPQNLSGAPYLHHYHDENIPISDRKGIIERFVINDKSFKTQFSESLEENTPMIAINNYAIDFKPYVINQKLINHYKVLTDTGEEIRFKFDEYELASLVYKINQNFKKDIDQQDGIKAIIDYQFDKQTSRFFTVQMALFILLCLLPFMMGLLIADLTHQERIMYNSIFTFSVLLQTMNEFIQIKQDGWSTYISDRFNKVDSIMIFLMYILSILRYIFDGNWMPIEKLEPLMGGPRKEYDQVFLLFMISLNAALFINYFFKVMFYMRNFESFGLLVELILGIGLKLAPFMLFMFFFVSFFTLVFLILGANFGETPMLNDEFALFNNVFQMLTGNISNPSHEFWSRYAVVHPHYIAPVFIVYVIYIIWLVFQIVICTVLLNFLIALISQAYEDTMTQANIKLYNHKAQLNRECYQFQDYWGKRYPQILQFVLGYNPLKEVDCFILQANQTSKGSDDWKGMTQTMGKAMKRENKNLVSDIKMKISENQRNSLKGQKDLQEEFTLKLDEFKKSIIDQLKIKQNK